MHLFTQVKSAKYMVQSQKNPPRIWVHFPIFLKLNVQSIIFSKFLHEIEAAAICFVMERGRRKSQQNSRICVRERIKLDDQQIKRFRRCRQSCFLFPNLSRKDRGDSVSRVDTREGGGSSFSTFGGVCRTGGHFVCAYVNMGS